MLNRIVAGIRGNLVAWLALFVALGGTSLAASHYVINSTKQINPKVLLPTHSTLAYIQATPKDWKATYSNNKTVTIPRNELPTQTTLLFMGTLGSSYGNILKAPETKW